MLDAVLVVGIGNVQIAVEELVLVLALHVHNLHVLDGAVIRLADVNAYHGVEKCVVALKCALQKRTGELAAVVGHVIGCKLHGIGVRCTKPDGEAIAQVHEHLRRVKAGVTERQVPLRLCLADKLVVRVLQQVLKVNQMLQFFHCGSSPCVIFIFTRLCHQN